MGLLLSFNSLDGILALESYAKNLTVRVRASRLSSGMSMSISVACSSSPTEEAWKKSWKQWQGKQAS